MIPAKLKKGDEIRVITPARSLAMPWITKEVQDIAKRRLKELGFKVTFGKHVNEINEFSSSSVSSRIEDLHDAFKDKNVKMILTVIGGFNSGELLRHIDYDLIKKNPKILCGYSDITAIANGIYAKTGLITYSGTHFFDFGELKNFDYTSEYFKKCFFDDKPYQVKSSSKWSEDKWGKDQENRNFFENKGMFVLNKGFCEGKIIGGNLVTLQSLTGSDYFPSLKNSILFLEEDDEENIDSFARNLNSITQLKDFSGVKGIVFGRFQAGSHIGIKELKAVIKNNSALKEIPIVGGVDFGHTTPKITFPIGGKVRVDAESGLKIEILEH